MLNNPYNMYNQNGSPFNNISNMMDQMNALRSNPIQFLAQRKLNLPPNFQGGPRDIVQYLLNSGQMSQDQFNRLQSFLR